MGDLNMVGLRLIFNKTNMNLGFLMHDSKKKVDEGAAQVNYLRVQKVMFKKIQRPFGLPCVINAGLLNQ